MKYRKIDKNPAMTPLRKWIVGFIFAFMVLTISSTFVRDFAGFCIIGGIVLLFAGYLGGGLTGEKYSMIKAGETTIEMDAHLKQRYFSAPIRLSLILLIIGAILFCAGLLGYFLNSTFISPY